MYNLKRTFSKISILLFLIQAVSIIAQQNPENQELIQQFTQKINESKAKNDLKSVALYSNKCASVYLNERNFQKAIEFYLQSVEVNNRLGNDQDNKKIYNNIAMIYSEMDQLKNSLKYFEKSLIISRRTNNKKEIAVSLMDIATILNYNKEYDKAIEYLNEALKLSEDLDDIQNLRTCYNLISQCYGAAGNDLKASEYNIIYQAYDTKIREGITSLKNTDKNFLSSETQDIQLTDKKQVTEADRINIQEYRPKYQQDSIVLALDYSNHRVAETDKTLSILNNEKVNSQLEIESLKNEKKQIIIAAGSIFFSILILLLSYGIYIIGKKRKYIRQLEKNILDLEEKLNKA